MQSIRLIDRNTDISKLKMHPIYTHEFPKYADKLKELSKPDFIEICRKLGD